MKDFNFLFLNFRLKPIDYFAVANLILFVTMCVCAYVERFIAKRGVDHLYEFIIYASAIIFAIIFLWKLLRKYDFPPAIFLLIEIGVLMHFAGGLFEADGIRLYRQDFAGLGYDKYVHFVNSVSGALAFAIVFRRVGLELGRMEAWLIVFLVQGCGGLIELIEYGVTKINANSLVGGYDNNMQDLLANLTGALVAILVLKLSRALTPRFLSSRVKDVG